MEIGENTDNSKPTSSRITKFYGTVGKLKVKECDCIKEDFKTINNNYYFIDSFNKPTENGKRTVECRIKYEKLNVKRTSGVNELKDFLDKTNFARNEVATKTSVIIDPHSSPGRTFGVAKVTEGGSVSYTYAMNSSQSQDQPIDKNTGQILPNFANNLPDKVVDRFIKSEEGLAALGFNSTHAEIKIIEHIASINNNCNKLPIDTYNWVEKNRTYNIYNCKPITVEIFTDRGTCRNCQKIYTNVVEEIFKGIKFIIRNYDYPSGDFPTNPSLGIFYSGEMIPRYTNGYYSREIK